MADENDIRGIHEIMKEKWDGVANPWDSSKASVSYLTIFYETYKDQLKEPYIDIGMGNGKHLYMMAQDGVKDIYGNDISPKLVDIARDKLREFLGDETEKRIITLDMLDLSRKYDKSFFNTIIFSGVLQQTVYSAAGRVMEEIAKISAPGALMYFSTRSISTPPKDGIAIDNEKGTFKMPDGSIKTYFERDDIENFINNIFEVVELEEEHQTQKLDGEPIMNWEGILRRI